jgi:hypothetical protein
VFGEGGEIIITHNCRNTGTCTNPTCSHGMDLFVITHRSSEVVVSSFYIIIVIIHSSTCGKTYLQECHSDIYNHTDS